jgi:peptidase C25-like protein
MKNIFALFILLLILSPQLKSQDNNLKREIIWLDKDKLNNSSNFLFHGANYKNEDSFIPFYNDFFPYNISNNVNIKLKNIKTEIVLNNEILKAIDISKIPEEFELSTSISTQRKESFLNIEIIPLRRNNQNQIEKLTEFEYDITAKPNLNKSKKVSQSFANNSVLASGDWYRIRISENGIYKLTFEELQAIGISNPATVSIYGNNGSMLPLNFLTPFFDDLNEIPLKIFTGNDGVFSEGDYLLFYAQGTNIPFFDTTHQIYRQNLSLYSDYNYYFITSDKGAAKQIETISSTNQNANQTFDYYDEIYFHEVDDTNLIKSGRNWFGETFINGITEDFLFEIPNRQTAKPIKYRINLAARSSSNYSDNEFNISLNEHSNFLEIPIAGVSLDSYTFGRSVTENGSIQSSQSNINISLNFNGGTSSAEGWLDYITFNTINTLQFNSGQLQFRSIESIGDGNISRFNISGINNQVKIWEVTDHNDVKEINYQLNGNIASITLPTNYLREFIVFKDEFLSVEISDESVLKIDNQNLHTLQAEDIIIVTHPNYRTQAEELAQIHSEFDNLSSIIVEPQQIYNEFSSGKPDVSAIRNFLKMFYDRATNDGEMPRYLILFGDGSYNNKTNSASNTNDIITFQSSNSLSETASFTSDDFFGLLDDDEGANIENKEMTGALDIGIGRLPAQNENEAQILVDKIRSYITNKSAGDWQNMLTFIADDADKNETIHMRDANILATYIEENYPSFNFDKIYLDAFLQESTPSGERYPEANKAINERIKKGTLLVNYTGHGNPTVMTHEHVLELNDIFSWSNTDKYPLFITASCEISRYDDWARTSAGEHILLNKKGGGIALLTTTRVVFAGANMQLNSRFYNYVFEKDNEGNYYRLGDIVRLTKNATGTAISINKRNFALLGDPALQLCLPEYKIFASQINDINVTEFNDTLNALSHAKISGYLTLNDGVTKIEKNGILYPVILDKKTKVETLANDGSSPFEFFKQSNILFKGKASITNGEFSFDFIIPKDIAYNIGNGKISFFADIEGINASGYYSEILIGGSSENPTSDENGPNISLFLNDSSFVNGGITNNEPKIVAYLFDDNGINTVGNGIGHDITAILDNDNANNFILNDYYESDIDSYKSGKVEYPLNNIEEGEHSIRLKVWDVYNNSSEDLIEFFVSESDNFNLEHVLNYPNPFTTNTDFFFEHNQPNKNITGVIQIFTISGKLVKSIPINFFANGFRSDGINWDGLDDYGDPIGKGVYLYQLKLKTEDGLSANKIEKLVILR